MYFNADNEYGCVPEYLCCFNSCIGNNCSSCWCYLFFAIFMIPIIIAIGLAGGALALAILGVPAYLF